jgi:GT2 family glycosyltransferase
MEPRAEAMTMGGDAALASLSQRVGAVVIAYHSDALVLDLVGKLPDGMPVVVVDNARDSALEPALKVARPDAVYRHFPENRGFGSGANAGVSHLGTEYVLILNPDADVDLAVIASGVAELDGDPRLAAVGERRWLRLNRFLMGYYLLGAVLLMRRSAFEEVGGFDEDFFLFLEDIDLSVRLEAAGHGLKPLSGLPRHKDGHSVDANLDSRDERIWLMGASTRLFSQKHRFSMAGVWARGEILQRTLWARKDERSRVWMKGYRDARGALPGCLRHNLFTTGVRRT